MLSRLAIEKQHTAITVEPVTGEDGFRRCQDILIEVWDLENGGHRNIIPTRLFQISHSYGGVLLGAYLQESGIVGFAWALPGFDEQANPFLFSDTLAVLPQYRDKGIGARLKFAQREWALRHNMNIIRWTYDPLEARNACLNISRLGAFATTYKSNAYGVGVTGPNKGLETDRLVVDWYINSPRANRRACAKISPEPPPDLPVCLKLRDLDEELLPVDVILDYDEPELLVPIPLDFQRLKESRLDAARQWRLAMRRVCEVYFSRGYAVLDFHAKWVGDKRYCYYRLSRDWQESLI